MIVSSFMTKAEDVVTCLPDHSIRTALDLMVTKKVGSVLVMDKDKKLRPIGIVTKTDMLEAFHKSMDLDNCTVTDIMQKGLTGVMDTMDKDEAAKILQKNSKHHAMVINKDGDFLGVISSLDIAFEVARDARAWPWLRPATGKFEAPTSPRGPVEREEQSGRRRSSFIQYIDNLEYLDM